MTAHHVKPAHIERTPENEQTRQWTAISKPTARSQPTAKIHKPQTAVVGKRSTTTSMPSKAGVCTKQNLNAQSTAKTKATVPEVNQRIEKPEEQSNTKTTLYKGTIVLEHIHTFLYIREKTCRFEHNRINASKIETKAIPIPAVE